MSGTANRGRPGPRRWAEDGIGAADRASRPRARRADRQPAGAGNRDRAKHQRDRDEADRVEAGAA